MALLLSKKVLLNSSFLATTTKVGCSVPLLKSAKVAAFNQASKQFSMMILGAHVAVSASSCCTSGGMHWSSNFARKGPVVSRSEVQHSWPQHGVSEVHLLSEVNCWFTCQKAYVGRNTRYCSGSVLISNLYFYTTCDICSNSNRSTS